MCLWDKGCSPSGKEEKQMKPAGSKSKCEWKSSMVCKRLGCQFKHLSRYGNTASPRLTLSTRNHISLSFVLYLFRLETRHRWKLLNRKLWDNSSPIHDIQLLLETTSVATICHLPYIFLPFVYLSHINTCFTFQALTSDGGREEERNQSFFSAFLLFPFLSPSASLFCFINITSSCWRGGGQRAREAMHSWGWDRSVTVRPRLKTFKAFLTCVTYCSGITGKHKLHIDFKLLWDLETLPGHIRYTVSPASSGTDLVMQRRSRSTHFYICGVPNHNIRCIKALYRVRSNLTERNTSLKTPHVAPAWLMLLSKITVPLNFCLSLMSTKW